MKARKSRRAPQCTRTSMWSRRGTPSGSPGWPPCTRASAASGPRRPRAADAPSTGAGGIHSRGPFAIRMSVPARTLSRMTTDPQLTAWLDQEDAHLAQVIRARRWAVQFVGPGEEADEPAFAYTIGLFGLGHPELVVVSLSPTVAHALLERAAELVAD